MESSGKTAETSIKTEENHIEVSFHCHPTTKISLYCVLESYRNSTAPRNEYSVVGCKGQSVGRLTPGSTLYSCCGSDDSALIPLLPSSVSFVKMFFSTLTSKLFVGSTCILYF